MNNLNNIPGEILKTSQLPDDMPTHLVGVIIGTSPKTVKYSTTLFASQIASQMTDVVRTSFVYTDPTWLGSLNWNKIINTPSTILGYGITDAVSSSRTLSINGTTYDLSANRSWTVGDVLSSGNYVNPSWINSLAWTKITGAPSFITGITSSDVTTALGYTPVTNARTLTINGTTYDLTANRSWSVGDLLSSGSYSNPSWITGLAWTKITGAPAFLTTETDPIYTASSWYSTTNNSADWNTAYTNRITSLTTIGSSGAATLVSNVLNIPNYTLSGLGGQPLNANLTSISALTFASTSFVKMTAAGTFALDTNTYLTAESDTLASVTGRGNVTTNAIGTGAITANGNILVTAQNGRYVGFDAFSTGMTVDFRFGDSNNRLANTFGSNLNLLSYHGVQIFNNSGAGVIGAALKVIGNNSSKPILELANATTIFGTVFNGGNILFQNGGTFTDSGFRLDVNGTARIQNQLTTTGSITAASAIARGVYMNQTLVASANNDVLVGLDIQPTFTAGAFTGVTNIALRHAGNISPSVDNTYTLGTGTNGYGLVWSRIFRSNNTLTLQGQTDIVFSNTTIIAAKIMTTTGNFIIQNGGTFTDAGFRLDVVGTARISGTTTITPDALTGTLATSSLDIAQTWNTTGTPTAIKLNVTDTASGSLSDLISLKVGGVDRFRVVKSGYFVHSSSGEINGVLVVGSNSYNAASQLEVTSTSRGFLPPRMTTTQKNAIATPPSGLIVYDTTLGKLCLRGASAWETITSS